MRLRRLLPLVLIAGIALAFAGGCKNELQSGDGDSDGASGPADPTDPGSEIAVTLSDGSDFPLEQDSAGRYILPPVMVDTAYQIHFSAGWMDGTGGWAVDSGALPAGITLNADGALHGTPTSPENACFTARVEWDGQSATEEFCLCVAEDTPNELLPMDSELNTILVGYSPFDSYTNGPVEFRMEGAGAVPYSVSLVDGELPPGTEVELNEDESGVYARLLGTTSGSGEFSFTLRGEDAFFRAYGDASGTHVIEREYSIEVIECIISRHCNQGLKENGSCVNKYCEYPQPFVPARVNTPRVADLDLEEHPTSYYLILPDALDGSYYEAELQVSQGDGIYHWEIDHGSLPPGITLSESGVISGTPSLPNPSQAETYNIRAVVTSADMTQYDDFDITVAPRQANQMLPADSELPDARYGVNYQGSAGQPSFIEFGYGSSNDYYLEIVSGALPWGLSFQVTETGDEYVRAEISGTPTYADDFTFTVRGYDEFHRLFGTDEPGLNNVYERVYTIAVF